LQIILVSSKRETLSELAHGLLRHDDIQVHMHTSKKETLELLAKEAVTAVVVADAEDDSDPKSIVGEITARFPMVNCGIVSDLPPEEFHEWTEGLGVFAQLSPQPTREEADAIVKTLQKFDAWLSGLAKKGAES